MTEAVAVALVMVVLSPVVAEVGAHTGSDELAIEKGAGSDE